MPSNKELIENISNIDADFVTDSMNNAQLAESLKNLRATAEAQPVRVEVKGYVVKEKKSIVTLAGIKGPGEKVLPKHVSGGIERLEELKAKGFFE